MSTTNKKHTPAPKAAKTPQERSAPSGRATTPPEPTNATDAIIEAMRKAGGDASNALAAIEKSLKLAEGLLDGYMKLVSDNGPKARDTVVGMTDMDVTATVARIARTSVALLGRLIGGREARALAVAVNDMTLLVETAKVVEMALIIALRDCTQRIVADELKSA